mgnify:CR=1 FL=1
MVLEPVETAFFTLGGWAELLQESFSLQSRGLSEHKSSTFSSTLPFLPVHDLSSTLGSKSLNFVVSTDDDLFSALELVSFSFALKKVLMVTGGVVAFDKVLELIGASGSINASFLGLDGTATPRTPF